MNEKNPAKLWNLNFFLLWQGHLISLLGDIAYEIALGFWILEVTGSTALMGTLMAVSTIPRVVISPLAGVWVDRIDRKWLLVWMDLIRGIFVVLVGIFAFVGIIQVWMVFVAGIILGICGAFFGTAINSSIPDIVPKTHVVKANSAFSLLATGTGIIGNSVSGFLYQLLKAPLMFLLNGISYVISGSATIFVKIPQIRHEKPDFRFFQDLKSGLSFVWNEKGIKYLFFIAAFLNFFAGMGFMLLLPLFQRNEHLGAGLYGILIGIFSGGAFLGFLLLSVINIKSNRRFGFFFWCGIIFSITWIVIPFYLYFPLMVALAFISGITNAILNALLGSILQLTIPQDKRGKVFGLLGALSQGLTPLSFATGGILAEFLPLRPLISFSFVMTLLGFLPMAFMPSIIKFINSNVKSTSDQAETF